MNKLSKKITLSIMSSIISLATGIAIALPISNNLKQNSSITNVSNSTQALDVSKIIPSEANDQNANISTKNGPVTFIGNTITALDWYGNKLWTIDFSTKVPDKNGKTSTSGYTTDYSNGSWHRAWLNWDYNRNTDLIWVLGFWSNSTKKQPIFGINASDGTIKHTYNIDYSKYSSLGNISSNTAYRFVSALSSGKIMIYGGAANSYDAKGLLYDPDNGSTTLITGNSASDDVLPKNQPDIYGQKYKWYFFNLIPIGNNKNLVEVVSFSQESTSDDAIASKNANYNVYFLLVDDKLDMIERTGTWSKLVEVAKGMPGYRNTQITPQRDYYSMLNGKVVTVVYNTAIIIDETGSDVKFGSYPMTDSKWIKSWAFDSNQNLYFKFKDQAIIYKVSGTSWSTLNNSLDNSAISPYTYLDLNGVNDAKGYANNLIMYNVYGYTGQLMMINSKYNSQVDTSNSNITVDSNTNKYGLAIAVTQNVSSQNQGDYKGMLNGDKSFQKTSSFKLSDSALKSKIPSEITNSDIETSNGFMKSSSDFTIKSMDDKTGDITIECKLYQIPWFTTTLPNDIAPKVIEQSYKTEKKITDKTSWKTLSTSTDYDFMNMKPSNIKVEDVENLDPFLVSFQSKVVTDANGKQLYPKKTYSVSNPDDAKGTIKISVKYEYIPMSKNYSGNTLDVQVYNAENTYTVFKTTDTPAFKFIGQTSNETSIDVTKVSELKNLLSANTLPSSFNDLNNSSDKTNSAFLQFINTDTSKGYPISKMNFTITTNDTSGTLAIKAVMPATYSPKKQEETFNITYTNLNKSENYKFSFKDATQIGTQDIKTMLPSSITDGDIINNFIDYKGFNSNDFTINKTANDDKGTLTISISLNKNYASEIGTGNYGFTNYVATKTFNGFMTKDQYNERFDIEFVSDDSTKLLSLKQMQVSEIYNAFNDTNGKATGLTVNGVKYNTLKDLIKKLLVKNQGSMVPTSWDDKSIIASMYFDNSQGTISFYVKIPKSLISGSNTDLNLVANYTGFVKGNINSTDDNLSFVANNMLENYLISKTGIKEEDFKKFTPSTFADWLTKDNNKNALQLISYKSGQYISLLEDTSKYTLTVVPNNVQRNVTIYIHFNGVINSQSLSEYSVTYTI